ncbi:MaoC/PaaZ C-terminal domain-containing protein [Nesterenkonia alkaliphila]|uniref:Acyl dehydratase n=1 Tax=Nesterenkonia alkaliphila TaxID=1463631 RepID=A0A7K1UL75_9MICC|nr:MaoC/PaaZ C-terminal domain-containing protein [Nesterenkonia alkaliphila]MVT27245.1 acyl dehydratase [Nesterenkonia alkaliphila]GFZ78339.1 acyl dehydratase [Nesterenkonia alkaliphila]
MPKLADLEKGQIIGTRTVQLSRADLIRYAAASGDHNPIHWNERFAQQVGLPGVIAHGMLTMGAAVGLVGDWAGDPAAVTDYQTRFSKPVPVPDPTQGSPDTPTAQLEITAKVGKLDEAAGTARIDLTVELVDGEERAKVLTKSQALVALS